MGEGLGRWKVAAYGVSLGIDFANLGWQKTAKSSRSQQTAIGHKLPAPDGSTYYDKLAKNCCHGFARLYATVFMKILFVHGPNSSNQNIRQAPPLSL